MCDMNEKVSINVGYLIIQVDPCIARLVKALNDNGYSTMASDCGHFKKPTRIELRDGRMMILAPKKIAKKMLKKFP